MSRWPLILFSRTARPAGKRLADPPALVSVVVPVVDAPCSGSFQRIRATIASIAAGDCSTELKVPMLAMPVDCEL